MDEFEASPVFSAEDSNDEDDSERREGDSVQDGKPKEDDKKEEKGDNKDEDKDGDEDSEDNNPDKPEESDYKEDDEDDELDPNANKVTGSDKDAVGCMVFSPVLTQSHQVLTQSHLKVS